MANAAHAVQSPFPLRDEIRVPKGTVLFRQGDPGDSMFIIEQGRVQILLASDGPAAPVAVLGPGDFFGELSLLSDAPRTATAETLEDATLLVVGRAVFAMMMQDDLGVVFRMLHAIGERLCRTDRRFWELTQRNARIALLAELLRSADEALDGKPARLDLARLAGTLNRDPAALRSTLSDLAARGAGILDDGHWRIDGPAHVRALLDLLRTTASGA